MDAEKEEDANHWRWTWDGKALEANISAATSQFKPAAKSAPGGREVAEGGQAGKAEGSTVVLQHPRTESDERAGGKVYLQRGGL